ncbi:MAG: hypothetical protein ACRYFV_25020 [Janthinobacterium lividum]
MADSNLPILFENVAGRLQADSAGFLRVYWGPGPRTLTDTGALFAAITKALLKYQWSKILVNQVHMQPFTTQEQLWIAQEWLPHAVREGGYRFGAVVVSANQFTRLATAFITISVQGLPILYRSFDKEEQAVSWIIKQRS